VLPFNGLADHVLAQLGAQRDLPVGPLPPGWFDHWSLNLPELILILVLLLCVGFIAYSVARLRGGGGSAWDKRPGAAADGGVSAEASLARAEALAAAGRYMEAVHELLLQCVAELRQRGAGRLAESLTSREILQRAQLPPAGQDALAAIIARVEYSYFGRVPADLMHWQECRQRFDRVRAALAEQAAAHG
jgi:hypothetical protein